jgi:hypothetical protein
MKNFALIFLFAISFANCKTVETQKISDANLHTESTLTKAETAPTSQNLLENLTKEQQKRLDKSFPPQAREILNNAEEIEIYVNLDKETKEMNVLMGIVPNTVAKISDISLKKQFLESFYYDAAWGDGMAGCWKPRHSIKAKYKDKSVAFSICYECARFEGSSPYGKLFGSLKSDGKSSSIVNEIIRKYGAEIQ